MAVAYGEINEIIEQQASASGVSSSSNSQHRRRFWLLLEFNKPVKDSVGTAGLLAEASTSIVIAVKKLKPSRLLEL